MAIYTIPASSIVNKLNIMSYNSACTITTITVAVVRSIYSQSVRGKPGTMNQVSTAYTINRGLGVETDYVHFSWF